MKKKNGEKLEEPTINNELSPLEIFKLDELEKIQQLIRDLRKIRKIEIPKKVPFWKRRGLFSRWKNTIIQLDDLVLQQQFFYTCDFILEMGWKEDRPKIEALWKILQNEFPKNNTK